MDSSKRETPLFFQYNTNMWCDALSSPPPLSCDAVSCDAVSCDARCRNDVAVILILSPLGMKDTRCTKTPPGSGFVLRVMLGVANRGSPHRTHINVHGVLVCWRRCAWTVTYKPHKIASRCLVHAEHACRWEQPQIPSTCLVHAVL